MRLALQRSVVAVVIGSLPVITAARLQVWASPRALWSEAIQHSPGKPRPWVNYGTELVRDGDEAIAGHAFQHAAGLSRLRMRVEGPMRGLDVALFNLAILRANAGQYDEALTLTAAIVPLVTDGRLVEFLERQWISARDSGGPAASF